ncbi:MAG TPA: PemK family transcriptional regulator, partial [Clostridiales bacterium]|nr:PemK family transcriptional regulator [Clostridiales bacterium]
TIDKRRLREKIGQISPSNMYKINQALMISLGLVDI